MSYVNIEGVQYNEAYVGCPDCRCKMLLRPTKEPKDKQSKVYYSCSGYRNFACRNYHPAWPDGRPMGEPAPLKLKDARKKVTQSFLEVSGGFHNSRALTWLRKNYGRISELNAQECTELENALFDIKLKKAAKARRQELDRYPKL